MFQISWLNFPFISLDSFFLLLTRIISQIFVLPLSIVLSRIKEVSNRGREKLIILMFSIPSRNLDQVTGVGRFVTWFILWITCQNVLVDRWELVTGVVSFSMLRSETSFTLNIMTGLSNSFFANITLSFTFPHLKMRSHCCWLDLFILDARPTPEGILRICSAVRWFWSAKSLGVLSSLLPCPSKVWERAG